VEGDAQDFPVERLRFGVEWFKVFDADVSIISQSHISDVTHDLTDAVFDEVPLVMFDSPELFPSVLAGHTDGLQPASVAHGTFSASPNVFPIVELLENLPLWGEYADCETLAVHINSDNVLANWNFRIFLGEVGDSLSVRGESVGFTHPTVLNQRIVSLVVPVSDNRDRNICLGFDAQRHEEPSFGVEDLTVAWNVEFDGDVFEFIPLDLTTQRSISQTTWLLKEVFSLTTEYHFLCNSISFLDFRFDSRKLAVSRAFTLNSLKSSYLNFVASVWSGIARCITLTNISCEHEIKNTRKEVKVPIPPPNKLGGLLGTRL
jgi:hypothetical protein